MSLNHTDFKMFLDEVTKIVDADGDRDEKLQKICDLLRDRVSFYDWVGFYIVDPEEKILHLGPFAGEPTEHVKIPFGQGVCGQVARDEVPMIVQDVSRESNYLSCSPLVRSEIVVPVFKEGRSVAQIDVDSHEPAAFSTRDRAFLMKVCESVSHLF